MVIFNKRSLIITSVLVATVFAFILCVGGLIKTNKKVTHASKSFTIVLDAGHGGIDGGVSGINTKVKESELNLKVVKKLENLFTDAGFNVVLTRTTDAGLYGLAVGNLKRKDMQKRKEIIEKAKPDAVISIHMNKYSVSSRRGAQVFFDEENENGKLLANYLQKSFNEMPEASRTCDALKGEYYILNCTKFTSVICECGFLSNPDDEALLITDEYQEKVSYAIFKGVINYLSKIN